MKTLRRRSLVVKRSEVKVHERRNFFLARRTLIVPMKKARVGSRPAGLGAQLCRSAPRRRAPPGRGENFREISRMALRDVFTKEQPVRPRPREVNIHEMFVNTGRS